MIYLFKKTVFNCRQATLLSLKKDDGRITPLERLKLWYHLLYCNACRRFVQQSHIIDAVGKDLSKSPLRTLPFNLSQEVQVRMQREIDRLNQQTTSS